MQHVHVHMHSDGMCTCILSHAPSRVVRRGVHACTGEYQELQTLTLTLPPLSLTPFLPSLAGEYQELQTKYKNKYRERVERQIRIVKPNASADEVTFTEL